MPHCSIKGYDVKAVLKTGGMSDAINLVKSQNSGKFYIEKRINVEDKFMKSRARMELEVLKRVRGQSHLNEMSNYLFSSDGRTCTFILEFCDRGTLQDLIKTHKTAGEKIKEDFVWHIYLGIAKGLAYLHDGIKDATRQKRLSGWDTICHLDLKPCNIFLTSSGQNGKYPRVVIGDFGCAETRYELEDANRVPRFQMCGTKEWYPLEGLPRAVGIKNTRYGPETDLWQMGATIHVVCKLWPVPDRSVIATGWPCGHSYSKELNMAVNSTTQTDCHKRYPADKIVREIYRVRKM